MSDQFCLKWNNYQVCLQAFKTVLSMSLLQVLKPCPWHALTHYMRGTSPYSVTSNDCQTHYKASLTNAFKSLLENEDFVDMTLSAGGKTLRAHKVVLSACSSYFKNLLKGNIGILV